MTGPMQLPAYSGIGQRNLTRERMLHHQGNHQVHNTFHTLRIAQPQVSQIIIMIVTWSVECCFSGAIWAAICILIAYLSGKKYMVSINIYNITHMYNSGCKCFDVLLKSYFHFGTELERVQLVGYPLSQV